MKLPKTLGRIHHVFQNATAHHCVEFAIPIGKSVPILEFLVFQTGKPMKNGSGCVENIAPRKI